MKNEFRRNFAEFSQLNTMCIRPKPNKIGLLGGTFNPIHNGHIDIANIALYEFLLGEVVFLPLGDPPHKKDEYIAPADYRLDMIRIAIEDEKRFSVNTIELYQNGYTYTVDTLERLMRNNKKDEYYFIIGADTLFELTRWKDFKRVVLLTNFICILRPGQDDEKVNLYAETLNNQFGYKIYIAKDRGPNISSSQIRKLVTENKLRHGLIPQKVASYIEQNRVYFKEE